MNTNATIDLVRINSLLEPVVSGRGLELVDLEWTHELGGWILRVLIDRPGAVPKPGQPDGVGVDDCANISHAVADVLDSANANDDLIKPHYNLEVSSPGLNRPLRTEAHFLRFVGQKAKIRTRIPVGGERRNFAGPIVAVEAGIVRIDVGDKVCEVPISAVEKANLVYEF